MRRSSAITIGTFDGIHRGHQHLLRKLVAEARRGRLRGIVVALAAPVRPVPGVLTTVEEKVRLLRRFPVDEVVVLPVSADVIDQPAPAFFDRFLKGHLGLASLVVGRNFAFGYGREGNIAWLRKYAPQRGVRLTVVPPVFYGGDVISSTRIRDLIVRGDVNGAAELLGKWYFLSGKPEPGRRVGRNIGFPTINLKVAPEKLLPAGVFAALLEGRGRLFPGIVNIGTRPTFFDRGERTVEVHLLRYRGQWPAHAATVHLCRFIRAEEKFLTVEALQRRIAEDRAFAESYFGITG